MALCTDPTLLTVLLSVVALGVVTLLINRFALRKPAESIEVQAGSPWRLAVLPSPGRKYRLCIRYDIRHHGGDDSFGLVVDYTLRRGGQVLARERAGVGDIQPPDRDRRVSAQSLVSFSSTLGDCRSRATFVLAKTDPFDDSMEIVAEGSVYTNSDAWLQKATVFIV